MLVSADARVEPWFDIRVDVRPALGYSDSGLFAALLCGILIHLVWNGGMYARYRNEEGLLAKNKSE